MSAPSTARPARRLPADRLTRALLALTLLGAALRFSTLGVQSYWVDEAVTVHLLHHSLGGLIAAIPDSESTPPLYYVIAWLWAKLFGTGEFGLRSLSALFGTAAVPVAYVAGARLVTARAGLVLAALTAVSPLLVWFSQEARAYALLALLCAASLAVFPRALERRGLWLWALVCVLALATHYFAIFVVLPEALLLVRRLGRRSAGAIAPVAIAGLALLPLAIHQASNDRADFIREIALGKRILQVPKQYLVGFDAPLEALATVLALVLACYAIWLLVRCGDATERRGARLAGVIALVALGLPLVLALVGIDYLITRNLIGGWFPVMTMVAAGLGVRAAPRAGALATGALCAVMLAVLVAVEANPTYQRSDWRGAAKILGPPTPVGRAFVIIPAAGSEALGLYTPDLHVMGGQFVRVNQIDVIATAQHEEGQTPGPPRPSRPVPPPPGFVFVGGKAAKTYTALRYRSMDAAGGAVDVGSLGPLVFATGGADFRYQPPSR
jgi:mannosyltransferase